MNSHQKWTLQIVNFMRFCFELLIRWITSGGNFIHILFYLQYKYLNGIFIYICDIKYIYIYNNLLILSRRFTIHISGIPDQSWLLFIETIWKSGWNPLILSDRNKSTLFIYQRDIKSDRGMGKREGWRLDNVLAAVLHDSYVQSARERGRFPFIATIATNGGKSEKHSVRRCASKRPSKSLDCRRIKFVTREGRDKHCTKKITPGQGPN